MIYTSKETQETAIVHAILSINIVAKSEKSIYFRFIISNHHSLIQNYPKMSLNQSHQENVPTPNSPWNQIKKKTNWSLELTFFNEDNGPLGLILGLSFQTKEATKLVNSCITWPTPSQTSRACRVATEVSPAWWRLNRWNTVSYTSCERGWKLLKNHQKEINDI